MQRHGHGDPATWPDLAAPGPVAPQCRTFEEFSGYYLGYNAELKATNGCVPAAWDRQCLSLAP